MSLGPFFYETNVVWRGSKRGELKAADLPRIQMSLPPEFGGEPGYWSPEHLLSAALESCLMAAFLSCAQRERLKVVSYRSSALARLDWTEDRYLKLSKFTVRAVVEVACEEDREKALRVMDDVERTCPISNCLNVPVQISIEVLASNQDHDERTRIA